ncbi:hypothetical protein [Allokutzneria sp. NRRL B-24872]|uniref:hypothetical protein n=1 Tax=Allokutzneria sp. NRRL B-24872 TaxID=1137961 RepID=UPI000A3D5BE3|nr:hypothetical protein [Allokutzneria sp. NRRL B-24872]
MKRLFSALLAAAAVIAALPGTASAIPAFVNASDCFRTAHPQDVVASLTPGGSPHQSVQLRCGDYTSGVIHIDAGHPIAENGADDVNVNACFNHIFSRNYYEVPAANGNVALRYDRSHGGHATLVYNKGSGNVVTMFTSDGPSGNNWRGCATG